MRQNKEESRFHAVETALVRDDESQAIDESGESSEAREINQHEPEKAFNTPLRRTMDIGLHQ
jgi:hypothetical protein